MTRDSAIAEVLLPLALDGPYSYRVPEGLGLEPGSYVIVPLGPRQMIGVVWALKEKAGTEETLERKISDITITLRSSDYLDVADTVLEDIEVTLPSAASTVMFAMPPILATTRMVPAAPNAAA